MPTAKIHGSLGTPTDLSATTNTEIYKVPASRKATAELNLCNRNATDVTIRYAHVPGGIGSLANAHYKDYGATVPANGAYVRTVPMSANAAIVVWASTTGVSASVDGVEEDA